MPMTHRLDADRAETRAAAEAWRKAEARFAESAFGMQAAAAQLRVDADAMIDSNDRDAMLRLATGYEQRAVAALRDNRTR
jgi:hypothetical protein